jgi:hypothetical protein
MRAEDEASDVLDVSTVALARLAGHRRSVRAVATRGQAWNRYRFLLRNSFCIIDGLDAAQARATCTAGAEAVWICA